MNIYTTIMKKLTFILAFIGFMGLYLFAAAPANYYNNANASNGNDLRQALAGILTSGHTVVSYNGLWTAFQTTDINPATGKIWDMYSDCGFTYSTKQCGNYTVECDCYNREHTTPQSWFNEASPMVSDLFNVYPTDGKVNGMRSNYPYGETKGSKTSGNGSKLGSSSFSGYSGTVFEPTDEYKGDLARTVMYMATRYANNVGSWTGEGKAVYDATNGLTNYSINLLLKWSRNDPVSEKEINRNDAVYALQHNRNPFIDFPGLEEYIWGNKKTELFYVDGYVTPDPDPDPDPNPDPDPDPDGSPTINIKDRVLINGQFVNFGQANQSLQKNFLIKTKNITGDLTVNVVGDMFSVSTATITKSEALNGYVITIFFTPTEVGDHSGTVTISGGDLPEAFIFNLMGSK